MLWRSSGESVWRYERCFYIFGGKRPRMLQTFQVSLFFSFLLLFGVLLLNNNNLWYFALAKTWTILNQHFLANVNITLLVYSMAVQFAYVPSSETQGQIVGTRESVNRRKNMAEKKSKELPEELLSPFFTFLRALFFRPFRLFLALTICPLVSEDA